MVANHDNILLHKHFELSLYKSTSVMWETDTGIQYSNTVHHQINTFQSTSWYTTQAIRQCRQMLLNIRTIQLNSKQYQPMNFVVWINCPCFECDNSSSTSQKIKAVQVTSQNTSTTYTMNVTRQTLWTKAASFVLPRSLQLLCDTQLSVCQQQLNDCICPVYNDCCQSFLTSANQCTTHDLYD